MIINFYVKCDVRSRLVGTTKQSGRSEAINNFNKNEQCGDCKSE